MATSEQIKLEVATPLGMQLEVETESVSAPSVHGEFAVLPGHLPLLAALRCGILKYTVAGRTHLAAIGPGFVEAEPDRVELLTDLFATPESIDVAATHEDLKQAEAALRAFTDSPDSAEYRELQRAIEWAQARLDVKAAASN